MVLNNFEDIPIEIVVKILSCADISCRDIINLCQLHSKYAKLLKYSVLWRKKFWQRWQSLYKQLNREYSILDQWHELYKLRHKYTLFIDKALNELAWKQYYKKDLSSTSFKDFFYLMYSSPYGKTFIIDELHSLINASNRYQDLTIKYYADICLSFVSQSKSRQFLDSFFNKPLDQQKLEEGIIFFSQWHLPCINGDSCDISSKLDEWSAIVWEEYVKEHEIRDKSLTPQNLNSDQKLSLMLMVSRVLYEKIGLKGNIDHNQWTQNSFIIHVVERKMGLPVTLSVIHKLVAERLSLHCDIIDFPQRVILRYIASHPTDLEPIDEINKSANTYFVDAFDRGKVMHFQELQMATFVDHILTEDDFKVANTKQILHRIARNLIANLYSHPEDRDTFRCFRFAVEFSLILEPSDFEMRFLLLKLYLFLGIEYEKVIENLNELMTRGLHSALCKSLLGEAKSKMEADNNRQLAISSRSDPINAEVQYSVGMIMMHRKYNYTCVIIGWDAVCQASEDWKRQMGVNNLGDQGENQPFYHVLVNDGTNRYAAQQILTYAPAPVFVKHPDLGMYFEEFAGSHFVPNARKRMEYPEDYGHTSEIIRTKYSPVDMQSRVYSLIDRLIDDMI